MVSNREIRRLFNLYAELLLLHEQDERLAALLSGAAYRMRRVSAEIVRLNKGDLSELFRAEIISLIDELKTTGTIETLDELIQLTPSGLFEMMRIKGIGGKKLAVLWKMGHIDTIDVLLQACKKHLITDLPGFGKKTQENIIAAIESYREHRDHFHYASVADTAIGLVHTLKKIFKKNEFSLCGDVRRQTTTVAGIEIITDLPQQKFNDKLLRKNLIIQSVRKGETNGHTIEEIPVRIYHVQDQFHLALFRRTGSEAHVEKVLKKLRGKVTYRSDDDVYKKAGLPYIVPEMRENVAEWRFAHNNEDLIKSEDIRGVVHNHTKWR